MLYTSLIAIMNLIEIPEVHIVCFNMNIIHMQVVQTPKSSLGTIIYFIFSTGYRYNFDPVTEQPLPGRFEWEKLDPPK